MTTSITFLDGSGDTTIEWDDDVNDKMLAVIEDLMKKGHTFLIVSEHLGGRVRLNRKVKKVSDITQRTVISKDDAIMDMFNRGEVDIANATRTGEPVETVGVLKKAADAIGKKLTSVPRYQAG